jgi:hypothetical protein
MARLHPWRISAYPRIYPTTYCSGISPTRDMDMGCDFGLALRADRPQSCFGETSWPAAAFRKTSRPAIALPRRNLSAGRHFSRRNVNLAMARIYPWRISAYIALHGKTSQLATVSFRRNLSAGRRFSKNLSTSHRLTTEKPLGRC